MKPNYASLKLNINKIFKSCTVARLAKMFLNTEKLQK